ncbi:hypothetical protein KEM55_002982, partial [Ascosphaera atra]
MYNTFTTEVEDLTGAHRLHSKATCKQAVHCKSTAKTAAECTAESAAESAAESVGESIGESIGECA